ncbi:hypothetical protein RYZ27_12355 [Hyphomonas sp. FCG-A18]|uniref:hypothetical protein n=1 Tax=Hyphomonas sp. FCG-A18 TaxID=3080019 RepID=UPI002B2E7C0E|nr:hypothetical protein RYZ27_12355 [Hyphomonas sp. FCG-A18]
MLRSVAVTGLAALCCQIAAAQNFDSSTVSLNGNVETRCQISSNGALEVAEDAVTRPIVRVVKSCNTYGPVELRLVHRTLQDDEGVLAQFDNKMFALDPSGVTNIDIGSNPEVKITTLALIKANVRSPLRVIVRDSTQALRLY